MKEVLSPEEELKYLEVVLEYDGVSKSKVELGQRISEWIATVEENGKIKQFQAIHKQSDLTTSRLNEHDRKVFAYENRQRYGDLATLGNILTKTPSRCPSVYATDCEVIETGNNDFDDKLSRKSDEFTSTKLSSISEGAKIRRAKAELQKRQCLERQETERQQKVLEQQLETLRIKQELDAKKAELQNIKELSRIDNQIELAKMEEESGSIYSHIDEAKRKSHYANMSYYNRSIEEVHNTPKVERDFPKQVDEYKTYYGSHVRRNEEAERLTKHDPIQKKRSKAELSQTERQGDIGCTFQRTKKSTDSLRSNDIVDECQSLRRGELNQRESLVLIAETLGSSIRKGFELPKRDCLKFDGNPMNYPRFIANFKTNIEERELSPNVRLTYLIQFCTGTAKEAISNCVMLPEKEAYLKAREILHNLYGQSHIITRAYINKVTKGGIIRDGESEKLQQLARDMENCRINLTQLGCESEINAQSNLEKIVARLPRYLQAEWAKEAFVSLEKGKVPTFKDLTTYIIIKAKLASSAFGQLIGSKPHEDKQKPRKQYGTSFVTGGERGTLNCHFCKK